MLFTGISGHRSSFAIATLVLIGLSLTARQVECDNTGISMISAKLANTSESSYFEPDTPIGEVNLDDMRNLCNATYKITDEYLQELNDTGSYPDETDQQPMCYIKCYLEKIGILSQDNKIYKQRAVEMLWTQAGEAIDGCLSEMIGNPCEQAYFLARCVSTRALVDGRSKDT